MKTITITIPHELDAAATAEAKRLGISKSELIRRGLNAVLPEHRYETKEDPWRGLAGFGPGDTTTEPGEIDRFIYDA